MLKTTAACIAVLATCTNAITIKQDEQAAPPQGEALAQIMDEILNDDYPQPKSLAQIS